MTQDEARGYLEEWLNSCAEYSDIELPIYDERVSTIYTQNDLLIEEYSFRYLLKTAYNLKEND